MYGRQCIISIGSLNINTYSYNWQYNQFLFYRRKWLNYQVNWSFDKWSYKTSAGSSNKISPITQPLSWMFFVWQHRCKLQQTSVTFQLWYSSLLHKLQLFRTNMRKFQLNYEWLVFTTSSSSSMILILLVTTIRYDMTYLRALKSWQKASLV